MTGSEYTFFLAKYRAIAHLRLTRFNNRDTGISERTWALRAKWPTFFNRLYDENTRGKQAMTRGPEIDEAYFWAGSFITMEAIEKVNFEGIEKDIDVFFEDMIDKLEAPPNLTIGGNERYSPKDVNLVSVSLQRATGHMLNFRRMFINHLFADSLCVVGLDEERIRGTLMCELMKACDHFLDAYVNSQLGELSTDQDLP